MSKTTITTEIHQTLDIHGHLSPEISFHLILGDFRPKSFSLLIVKILDLDGPAYTGGITDPLCGRTTDTEDSR